MSSFAIVDSSVHRDLTVNTNRGAAFGDNLMFTMTYPMEFRDIQSCYPIFFSKDPETGQFYPVALLGFEEQSNLFLNGDQWEATYIPMTIRRQPFLIGFQPDPAKGDGATKPVVSIDMDSPRVTRNDGEALFNEDGEDGKPTDFLQKTIGTLEAIHHGLEHNKGFVAALLEKELLESFTLEITLNDGSNNKLMGFYTIAEEKLQSLDGETLEKFNAQGYLQSIYMAMASFSRIRPMIDKKNAALD